MTQEIHVGPIEARRLAAGARDVALVSSFLTHCDDTADAERSLASLRKNMPEQFLPRRQQTVNASPTRGTTRDTTRDTTRGELLSWSTVNQLVRDSDAIDWPMLSSYLRWYTNERAARAAICTLRQTHPEIWTTKVTPANLERGRSTQASAPPARVELPGRGRKYKRAL